MGLLVGPDQFDGAAFVETKYGWDFVAMTSDAPQWTEWKDVGGPTTSAADDGSSDEDDEVPVCMAADAVEGTSSGKGEQWSAGCCAEKIIFNAQNRPVSIGCGSGFACKGTCKHPEFAGDAQSLQ
jgi:hypothetical protein